MTIRLDALPPRDAIAALEARGKRLDPSFAWPDVWQAEHASSFTVAKSHGFDILQDILDGVKEGLVDGKLQSDFNKRLIPILQAKGWWGRQTVTDPATGEEVEAQLGSLRRLKTIFDVNMRVSYAAGHWANFERNKALRPYLRYVAILDDRTRPEHAARHNLCLPVDHPYWNLWAPPCGWSCRCTLISLSARQVEAMRDQLKFEPPKDVFQEWVNKRTGEVSQVPEGIDPGWAYNPGKAGYEASLALSDKLIAAPPAMAAEAARDPDWLQRPLENEFPAWVDRASSSGPMDRSTVAVGALSRDVLRALEDRGVAPESGAVTIDQRTVRRMTRDAKGSLGRAVPIEVLRLLPRIIAQPRAVLRDKRDGAILYVFNTPGSDLGKIVVRLDFATKVRDPGQKPVRISTNAVRTAGIVSAADLRVGFYEVLSGAV